MGADFSQDTRLGKMHSDLGQDVLLLCRFGGAEYLNNLFEFRIEVLSKSSVIDFDKLLGTHVSIEIETIAQGKRFFDGIVVQARWVGPGANGYQYELILRPWFWLAGNRRQQRIFHNMTVPQILEKVLAVYASAGEMTSRLKNSYVSQEYTVQYGESDLRFARRLMERVGISFHFEHAMGKHDLVLTDTVDELPKIPGESRKYLGSETRVHGEDEHFWTWAPERNFVTGAIRLTDYNFKTPTVKMEVERPGDATYEHGMLEGYDFPGDYLDPTKGKAVATLRLAQERGQDQRHRAVGDVLCLGAGMRITLEGQHEDLLTGQAYVCLTAQHFFEADGYGSGAGSGSGTSYTGSYTLISDSAPIAPPRQTPTPVIPGPQTAVVVGAGEIDCDEFGRVLVLFHWDIAKANSMRVRSGNSWAHNGWGGMTIPRIGMEVIVEFLNGDPDQPIITGHVYNGRNMPPYALPANKTRTTFKTKTHGGSGFNELRFEDEAGKEEVFIHAQKDRNEKTLNNLTGRTDNNLVQSVGNNKSVEVQNNHSESIGGNMTISVGPAGIGSIISAGSAALAEGVSGVAEALGLPGALNPGEGHLILNVEKTVTETIGISQTITIGVSQSTTVGAAIDVTSGSAYALTVGDRMSETVGEDRNSTVGNDEAMTVGNDQTSSVGGNRTDTVAKDFATTVGKRYVLTVTDELAIVVGKASITMKKDGTITLKGKDITLNGSGKINAKASGDVSLKGSKVNMN